MVNACAPASLNYWIPVVGTLLGVILGGAVGYIVHWAERRRELRSVLQALLWELEDAKPVLGLPTAILRTPIPSVDTLLTRGLLCSIPKDVRGPVLAARSLVQLHSRNLEEHEKHRRDQDPAANKEEIATLTGLARCALPAVVLAIDAVSDYLGKHVVSRKFQITPPSEAGRTAP